MFNKSKALLAMFIGAFQSNTVAPVLDDKGMPLNINPKLERSGKGKGRSSSKPSGVAAAKRAAAKRRNIRKRSAK